MGSFWDSVGVIWPPLVLLLVAHGAPIMARWLLGDRLDAPLDGARNFIDGRPLLGPGKGWRGVAVSTAATAASGWLLGVAWWLAVDFALLAMAGDALTSFIKRRLAIPPHGRAILLDQLLESLLPLWVLRSAFGMQPAELVATVTLFTLLDVLLSPLLHRWHLRRRPY